ncbi:MAG: FMN-binding protein [Bacillota bacterium]
MKKILKVFGIVAFVFLLAAGGGLFYISRGIETIVDLEINQVEISSLSDGSYIGEFNQGRFSNKVKLEIENGRIANISLLENVTFAKPEVTEELYNKIIDSQNNKVDVISGSTVTCNAYLKAIENALTAQE